MKKNTIYHKSCVPRMDEMEDESIHLIVTSPPYNVGIPYHEYLDNLPMVQYMHMLKLFMAEAMRVLVPGGRTCLNIANIGRTPYIPLATYCNIMALELGFLMRGEVVWNKGEASARGSTNMGTFKSCKNPVIRDCHEYILIYSKDSYDLDPRGYAECDITSQAFGDDAISIWNMGCSHNREHPAAFPEELPRRCIEFYTAPGMNVLDPFMGSGTTAIAAFKSKRNFIGYELDKYYVDMAMSRLGAEGFNTFDPMGW